MRTSDCLNCGGNDFYSDRALAGRLICRTCGTPQGSGGIKRSKRNIYQKNYFNFFFIIITIVIIIVLLN